MSKKSESRSSRFQRLATKRTNAVLERLRVLGHCANKSLYEYNEDEVKKIFSVIEAELKTTKAKFQRSRRASFQL